MASPFKAVFGGNAERAPTSDEQILTGSPTVSAESTDPGVRTVMIIGKTLVFKGELSADEDMILHGQLEGTLTHSESVTIGASGSVVGDIHARHITIKGTVDGDLHASESVVIAPSAHVTGDIIAPRVSIVEGAEFNGSVEMRKVTEAPAAEAPSTGLRHGSRAR